MASEQHQTVWLFDENKFYYSLFQSWIQSPCGDKMQSIIGARFQIIFAVTIYVHFIWFNK